MPLASSFFLQFLNDFAVSIVIPINVAFLFAINSDQLFVPLAQLDVDLSSSRHIRLVCLLSTIPSLQ